MPLSLPTWLHPHLLDLIRRCQPMDMSDIVAAPDIAEALADDILPIAELRATLRDLAARCMIRDVRPKGAPLWRLSPAGQEALERHAACAPTPGPDA